MDKRIIIVVLLVVLVLWFTTKMKAQKPVMTEANGATPTPSTPSGEPAEKNVFVASGDTWFKIVSANWDFINSGLEKTKENILSVTKLEAERNGFDWDLYDDKPTANAQDPDFLKPGQKLVIENWTMLQMKGKKLMKQIAKNLMQNPELNAVNIRNAKFIQ